MRDLRHVTAHEEVFAHLCAHLEDAFHGGHLRPLMSVFGPGVRVHNLPDLAYFNHSQHTQVGGIQCQTCHGPIQNMEAVYQYSALTMG